MKTKESDLATLHDEACKVWKECREEPRAVVRADDGAPFGQPC
jgi:hypothetical protein